MSDDDRPVEERWVRFFDHISHYHRLYGALLGTSGSPWFADRMRATLTDLTRQHLPDTPAPSAGLVPTLVAAMFVQTITWWLENDRPVSARRIAAQSAKLAIRHVHRGQQLVEPEAHGVTHWPLAELAVEACPVPTLAVRPRIRAVGRDPHVEAVTCGHKPSQFPSSGRRDQEA